MRSGLLNIVRGAFASLFLVFNVGLPIVIDTCPMPKPVGSMLCPFCHEEGGKDGRETLSGKSCCSPVIAAERNSNEFLTVQKILGDLPAGVPAVLPSCMTCGSFACDSQTFAPAPSQFAPDDIPVIHSSLLI